jgi:hypothetical protein
LHDDWEDDHPDYWDEEYEDYSESSIDSDDGIFNS